MRLKYYLLFFCCTIFLAFCASENDLFKEKIITTLEKSSLNFITSENIEFESSSNAIKSIENLIFTIDSKKIFIRITTFNDANIAIKPSSIDIQLNQIRKINYPKYQAGLFDNMHLIIFSDDIANSALVENIFHKIINSN